MIRCIFCGMCEEVCPEQAIFLRKDYAITGFTRAEMVHHKDKLLEIGGVIHGVVWKGKEKKRLELGSWRIGIFRAWAMIRTYLSFTPSIHYSKHRSLHLCC